jgi:hypothetical protein
VALEADRVDFSHLAKLREGSDDPSGIEVLRRERGGPQKGAEFRDRRRRALRCLFPLQMNPDPFMHDGPHLLQRHGLLPRDVRAETDVGGAHPRRHELELQMGHGVEEGNSDGATVALETIRRVKLDHSKPTPRLEVPRRHENLH